MYLFTYHGMFLAFDGMNLIQTRSIADEGVIKWTRNSGVDTSDSESHALPSDFKFLAVPGGIAIEKNGKFASASPHVAALEIDRDSIYEWETFIPIDEVTYRRCEKAQRDPASERDRLAKRIEYLRASGAPVKIYAGAGRRPRPGFINVDIEMQVPGFFVTNSDDYYIFPFVSEWNIPDNSVDYIFDEDFMEHVSQLLQWQYLAETRRILKTGSWHRINTPNIIAAMKRHSDFGQGFRGVYTGELRWGHVSILSHLQLKEIAETIGYREVVFTTKSHGVSPFAVEDFRPSADRDQLTGNIYADLLK